MTALFGSFVLVIVILLSPTLSRGPTRPATMAAYAGAAGPSVSVTDFGARGDGVSDDSPAVQAAINGVPNGATIYFPAGTYMIRDLRVIGRSSLRFSGERASTVLKRLPLPGNVRQMIFESCTDIDIEDLTFDANGIERFGGVNFYGARRVRIENTRFIDSKPRSFDQGDHYAYVFGHGGAPSEDISIANNIIENLNVEVDHARRVRVIGNTVSKGYFGIGIFTAGNESRAEDYLITGNVVVDTMSIAFPVLIDPPSNVRGFFKGIRIVDNKVLRRSTRGPAVLVGTGDYRAPTMGNVFEDITVQGNTIEFDRAAPPLADDHAVVSFQSSARSGFMFLRAQVKGNRITGNGTGGGLSFRRLLEATVAQNTVGGVNIGIGLGESSKTLVEENVVNASGIAYLFASSLGGNQFRKNQIVGTPKIRFSISGSLQSDSVDER